MFGLGKPKVKDVKASVKEPVKQPDHKADALFRLLRLQESRIAKLETDMSALRRDVNRIDRKQYRVPAQEEPALAQPAKVPAQANFLDPWTELMREK